ncbi:centromere-associated protein E [Echinops telfairi]|uniref:Centromere-associated protein E n=1 Tax=Echinops telfairi TaxID=9371 RepID=A0AC55CMP1_ECHTE|nr:centromere-associated protein E [Echinops telfairi]
MAEAGAVAVCVRVRPLNSREEALGEDTQVYWKTDKNTIYQVDGSKSFNFDRVFHSNETTKNVYEEIAVPIIESAIQGYNGTIFAYGQTASGKTYTMMGSPDYLGVIPRAIHDIFKKIKEFPDREFLLRVSYMEIYNETITDLLCDTRKMKPLVIREDFNRNVYVSDLTEEVVYTSEMALKWITKGEKNRHYGITKMNQRSSRSHTIFRMILESREKGEPANCEGSVKVSHLNLVDLAGSERAAQTGAEGVRLKEGCNINRSLFILGQVIKKLSDGQVGGFINYRDSKLTRILQNSLGGNAKTRIICTITPVSFDETLTTLQFASTAKYMKNTPYVNEVSSDEALLKRYRKEIMDLKKQLEEVSLETRAQAMEKDQLAQLLEEKDLLQKVQIEKIQNLTQMLVTSSSLTAQQELKAKKKRRVTWCLGKINKMKDSNYVNEFNRTNVTTKTNKAAVTLLGEIDESFCSEADVFSNTLDTVTEIEWNPATKLLSPETLESELSLLQANYESLTLDYEQLRRENEEMELRLKEKNDLDEFEALEKKTKKDQEMQLIHEISNLKNLVKHSEVYNQDLEHELSSKVELLREKEDQIQKLQKYIDSQKSQSLTMDLSCSAENTEDLKQMKQTLFDAETVTLDAKRQSAFLRSENLELKEKMKDLEDAYKQMENDIKVSQRQLETKKKMQVDLEKELQFAFNEIAKLTSLVDGKVPKDMLCSLELERRTNDLQKELNRKNEENAALCKEVDFLSELKSLSPEVEMLRKEIHDKSEELNLITAEKDKLFSEVANKENRIQGLLGEIENTKDDLATARLNYKSMDQEVQVLKASHKDIEERYKVALEENERMNQKLETLSNETAKLGVSLDSVKTKLSPKAQELQQKTNESQETLNEMEELKEKLENRDSRLQTIEKEKALLAEKLQQTVEEVRILTQEKDELKQLHGSLQIERDQLKSDIQDTVNMNIDTQEQLRNALESLKQYQDTINTLKMKVSEGTSKNLYIEENRGETMNEIPEEMIKIDKSQILIADIGDNKLIEQEEKIFSLIQEKNELQQMLENITAENEQLKTDLKDNIEMTIENQEELRFLGHELKKQQETVAQEKSQLIVKEDELSRTSERLAQVEKNLQEKSQQLEEMQQQLLSAREKMGEMQTEINEMENLKNELQSTKIALEHVEMEKLEFTKKLNESVFMSSVLETKEELKSAHVNLKGYQETIDELRRNVSEKTTQIINLQKDLGKKYTELQGKSPVLHVEREPLPNVNGISEMWETGELERPEGQLKDKGSAPAIIDLDRLGLMTKLQEGHEEIKSMTKEKDDLKMIRETLQVECDQLKEEIRVTLAKIQEAQDKQEQSFSVSDKDNATEKLVSEMEQLKEQFKAKDATVQRIEMEKLKLAEELQASDDEVKSVTKERDDLKRLQGALQSESDQLKEDIGELTCKHLETEKELKIAHLHLKEHKATIDELRVNVSERETEIASIQKELEAANAELQEKMEELRDKQEQQLSVTGTCETQETVSEQEQLVEQLRVKDSLLHSVETEKLKLAERLQESQEEIKSVTMERNELKRVQEVLQRERDQLKENISEIVAKCQELQEKEHQLLKVKNALKENMYQIEQLKKQSETQNSILESTEMEKVKLSQRLHETLDELRSATKEKDDLRRGQAFLQRERDQLRESLQETETKDLEKQEELKIAHMHLKANQENIDRLRWIVSEKADEMLNMQKDLEASNAKLQEKIQEQKANEHQLRKLKEDVSEAQKKISEVERLKKQLKAQSLTLDKIEMENLNLAQKLHEHLEEKKCVMKERDELKRVEEMLKLELEQLQEDLREVTARDLETQQELKTARKYLKEHQEAIDKYKEKVSEKTAQVSTIQKELDKSKDELQKRIQEVQKKELQLLKLKEDISKIKKKVNEMEELKNQFESQYLSMQNLDMENLHLTKKLHENCEEIKIIAKERDELKRINESLKMERNQFREALKEIIARDPQSHREVTRNEQSSLRDAKQHLTENLREKCFRIKGLLKKYSEIDTRYECLNMLSLDLEKEIEIQKELSVKVKAKLSLPYSQTKQIQKLLTVNQRCSTEFHRIMEKLKYVLSLIAKIKEEHHEAINKLEMDFTGEVEKQNELLIKMQHLQQDCDWPSSEHVDLKLSQNMDLHIEEILKDFSENDFLSIKTEFQQVLEKRKEMTRFLEEWLTAGFDIEILQNDLQQENDRICQVNNFYNNKIIAIMSESTEFEESSAATAKEWERDLRAMREGTERMRKNYQSRKTSRTSRAVVNAAAENDGDRPVTSRPTQLASEKIQELEASLHEAKESAKYKESKIIKMQKELEMTNGLIAKLQAKVNESNQCLQKTKEIIEDLQNKVALGAEPYKEEIEDLKTKLVKIDLEKMKNTKEFEKEITVTKATVEYQKDVIRLLKENLRRSQQIQDTSMLSENVEPQAVTKAITCGGGSGIVQSTQVLIWKSEHMKLESEVSKLKQRNEQLMKQQNELRSNNLRLSKEIKTWKERTIIREAPKEVTYENSPKSPKVPRTPSKNRQNTPSQCKERNSQESPKSWFFDSRSKSFPTAHPVRYFDNSSLGLCPEEHTIGAENVAPPPDPWRTSSGKEKPECTTQ